MAWKSYRSHGQLGESSPLGAIVAALCIVLMLVAPWLVLAIAVIRALNWLVG